NHARLSDQKVGLHCTLTGSLVGAGVRGSSRKLQVLNVSAGGGKNNG
ncbi:MAG: hypothetical protein ACI8V5_004837, partial [Limisphaerales bacterium]